MQKLDTFNFTGQSSDRDWDEWLDGSIVKLVQGADFDCKLSSMRAQVNSRAAARELKVRTSVITAEKAIVFQTFKD